MNKCIKINKSIVSVFYLCLSNASLEDMVHFLTACLITDKVTISFEDRMAKILFFTSKISNKLTVQAWRSSHQGNCSDLSCTKLVRYLQTMIQLVQCSDSHSGTTGYLTLIPMCPNLSTDYTL